MTGVEFIKSCAALHAWSEGRKYGFNGMLGILFVIRNRAQQNQFNGDWLKIIYSIGTEDNSYPDVREPEFQRLLQWVDGVYDGTVEDKITNGATYYSTMNVGPDFQREICAVVGGLTFYK